MRRHLDALFLLALFSLVAFAVLAHTRLDTATAKPSDQAEGQGPSMPYGAPTKFDLLFGKHELALP